MESEQTGLLLSSIEVVGSILISYCITHRTRLAGVLLLETGEKVIKEGLDNNTLVSFPKLVYSKDNQKTYSCCSVCLADYKDGEVLRVLLDCGHVFHLKCVDSWLRLHPTCPICRNSPSKTSIIGEV
ncbi:hypothetical protein UlMin_043994 [Ulmus minor]